MLRKIIYTLFLFAIINTAYSAEELKNEVKSHDISVKIIPEESKLVGKDIISLDGPLNGTLKLTFLACMNIESVQSGKAQIEFNVEKDSMYQTINIRSINKISSFEISYSGVINFPPDERSLKQKHAESPGIISDKEGEGIYLPPGSFYPYSKNGLADFNTTVIAPDRLHFITSGQAMQPKVKNGIKTSVFMSELRTDNITLVGGKYHVADTVYKGVRLSVCTFKESKMSSVYLKTMIKYFDYYTNLFGPYPYSSFSVVENFFATGYGMPNYTLLSGKLMMMPWVVFSPGSLAHEFVHNWWGNSIYVGERENWCEALTSFSANYYYYVLNSRPDKALDWRKKALMSIEALPESANYPLKEFKYQRNTDDAVIGYQKGGFMFFELLKAMGKEDFFNALKDFAKTFKGKTAVWADIKLIFLKHADKNIPIDDIFTQLLENTRIPKIKLSDIKKSSDKIEFTISQDIDFYTVAPVRIITDKDTLLESCIIDGREKTFKIKKKGKVISLKLDPEYRTIRRLYYWEAPFTLKNTLNANPLVILPKESSDSYAASKAFAEMLKESYGCDTKSMSDINEAELKDRTFLIVGDPSSLDFINKTISLTADFELSGTRLKTGGKEYSLDGNLFMANFQHPYDRNKTASLIFFKSLQEKGQLRRLFHYLSYSMLVISQEKMGRPIFSKEVFPKTEKQNELNANFE